MPIYEYRCPSCGRRSSRLWTRFPGREEEAALACPSCGARDLARAFSRFARPRSSARRMDALLGAAEGGGLGEEDPRGTARLLRTMCDEAGEPLEAGEAEILERMEAGELPADGQEDGGEGGEL